MKFLVSIGLSVIISFSILSCGCNEELAKVAGSDFMNSFGIEKDALIFTSPDSTNHTLEGMLPIIENEFFFGGVGPIQKSDSFHVLLRVSLDIFPERSKCNLWLGNSIDSNSYEITCSRGFEFNGKELNSTDNLLDLRASDGAPAILQPIWETEKIISCLMRNVFFKESNFDMKDYVFIFKCRTDDGVLIRQTIQLRFL